MAKTKPIGVRFREDILDSLKTKFSVGSPQKALVFLESFYVQHHKLAENIIDVLKKEKNNIPCIDKTLDVGVTANEVLSDSEKTAIKERISVLESELKNPPKTATIGVNRWIEIRKTELAKLKKQIIT